MLKASPSAGRLELDRAVRLRRPRRGHTRGVCRRRRGRPGTLVPLVEQWAPPRPRRRRPTPHPPSCRHARRWPGRDGGVVRPVPGTSCSAWLRCEPTGSAKVAQWATTGAIAAEFVKCLSVGGGQGPAGRRSAVLRAAGRCHPARPRPRSDRHRPGRRLHGSSWTRPARPRLAGCRCRRPRPSRSSGGPARRPGRAGGHDRASRPRTARRGRDDDVGLAGAGRRRDRAGWHRRLHGRDRPGPGARRRRAASGAVLLADFRLHAEQAMLHDARDVVPGVQELVDAFRAGRPADGEVRALTFAVPERGYQLLLGLRRARAWSTIRPRAVRSHPRRVAPPSPRRGGRRRRRRRGRGRRGVGRRRGAQRDGAGDPARADAVVVVGRPA